MLYIRRGLYLPYRMRLECWYIRRGLYLPYRMELECFILGEAREV